MVDYLDNAATAPLRAGVLEAMLPFLGGSFGNASSRHTIGERAASALADARTRVAAHLGMRRGDVLFTSGGTEGNNTAVKGIAIAAQQHRGASHVVTSAIEHESVLQSVDYLARVHGFDVTILGVDAFGRVSPDELAAALRDDTALVSIGLANNEVGTVQDIPALAAIARGRRIPFHTDAVQAAGWLDLSSAVLGVDALTIAGHKLGAPQGTGVLAVRGRIPLEPLMHGGGQERGRRSGTESIAGAVALATALDLAEAERAESAARVAALRAAFVDAVLSSVPAARLTGDPEHRLPGTASFTIAGTSGEAVLLELDRRGVVSSSGSACAAGRDDPSHVLLAMGIPPEVAQTAVRFTIGHDRTEPLDDVARAFAESIAAVRGGLESGA